MKKGKWLLWMLLGLCIGVVACVLVYLFTMGDVDWQTFLKETILPEATIVATSIGSLCLIINPWLKKVTAASNVFSAAKSSIDLTLEGNKAQDAKNKAQELKNRDQEVKNRAVRQQVTAMQADLDQTKKSVENIEKILRIGFGNMEEMVVNGYAHEIAKVGAQDEKTKPKRQNRTTTNL